MGFPPLGKYPVLLVCISVAVVLWAAAGRTSVGPQCWGRAEALSRLSPCAGLLGAGGRELNRSSWAWCVTTPQQAACSPWPPCSPSTWKRWRQLVRSRLVCCCLQSCPGRRRQGAAACWAHQTQKKLLSPLNHHIALTPKSVTELLSM